MFTALIASALIASAPTPTIELIDHMLRDPCDYMHDPDFWTFYNSHLDTSPCGGWYDALCVAELTLEYQAKIIKQNDVYSAGACVCWLAFASDGDWMEYLDCMSALHEVWFETPAKATFNAYRALVAVSCCINTP